MEMQFEESSKRHEEAEAVGRLLANEFVKRVMRFPSTARRPLLIACRQQLCQDDTQIARTLFEGD